MSKYILQVRYFFAVGNGAVPLSCRSLLKQSNVFCAPFLSCGQAQRWHSPAAFLQSSLIFALLLVSSLYVLWGFFWTQQFPWPAVLGNLGLIRELYLAIILPANPDSWRNFSQFFNTWSYRLSLDVLDSPDCHSLKSWLSPLLGVSFMNNFSHIWGIRLRWMPVRWAEGGIDAR
jgi:hypothetical protein